MTIISKNAKSVCQIGMVEDMKVKEAHPRIFRMGNAIGAVTCNECNKKRVVCSVDVPDSKKRDEIMKQIKIEMKKKPYVCRYKLIT